MLLDSDTMDDVGLDSSSESIKWGFPEGPTRIPEPIDMLSDPEEEDSSAEGSRTVNPFN